MFEVDVMYFIVFYYALDLPLLSCCSLLPHMSLNYRAPHQLFTKVDSCVLA